MTVVSRTRASLTAPAPYVSASSAFSPFFDGLGFLRVFLRVFSVSAFSEGRS
jgi:hypothetical protein